MPLVSLSDTGTRKSIPCRENKSLDLCFSEELLLADEKLDEAWFAIPNGGETLGV